MGALRVIALVLVVSLLAGCVALPPAARGGGEPRQVFGGSHEFGDGWVYILAPIFLPICFVLDLLFIPVALATDKENEIFFLCRGYFSGKVIR